MILKIEGSLSEVTEFLDRVSRPRVIPFPVLVHGCTRTNTDDHGPEKEKKKEAGPESGAPSKEKKADTLAAYPKLKTAKVPADRPIVTQEDVKGVDLGKCNTIPEAINVVLEAYKISGAYLGGLLGIDKSVFSKARNGTVSKKVKQIFEESFPSLKLDEKAALKKAVGSTPTPSAGKAPKKIFTTKGSQVNLDSLLKVDLSDCDSIPEAINKLQLETNISGNRLAEILEIHASDLSKARKGITPPYIERAFKQYLWFPGIKEEQE